MLSTWTFTVQLNIQARKKWNLQIIVINDWNIIFSFFDIYICFPLEYWKYGDYLFTNWQKELIFGVVYTPNWWSSSVLRLHKHIIQLGQLREYCSKNWEYVPPKLKEFSLSKVRKSWLPLNKFMKFTFIL